MELLPPYHRTEHEEHERSYPTPKALFHDYFLHKEEGRSSPPPKQQPGSWPQTKADRDSSLSKRLCDAAARRDFETVEQFARKLLSFSQRRDARAIAELASGTTPLGGRVHFAPFVTSVDVAPHGWMQVDQVPSGVASSESSPAFELDAARRDAKDLLALLEPFLKTASQHASSLSPRSSPILSSESFGPKAADAPDISRLRDAILKQSHHVKKLTALEPRLLELESPIHVLGDIHGNLVDLDFFKTVLWPAGPAAAAGAFLFLGDFVDRGPDSIAVLAYVIAHKCLEPSKWWLIRGNHETREVNGNIDHYGQGSFLWQCCNVFGDADGHHVWEAVNCFFDTLPLAASIDNSIFCVHGGIPRALCQENSSLDQIAMVPNPLRSAHENQMVYDMLWSDPSTPDQEEKREIDHGGFGLSPRGCGCFGDRSIDIFLEKYHFQHIFRGHEAQKAGVGVSKNSRLTTIFSTSKDHFKGDRTATCGCVLVDKGSILPIVRAVPEEAPSEPKPPWPLGALQQPAEASLPTLSAGTAPDARGGAQETGVQRVREATGSLSATLSNALLGKHMLADQSGRWQNYMQRGYRQVEPPAGVRSQEQPQKQQPTQRSGSAAAHPGGSARSGLLPQRHYYSNEGGQPERDGLQRITPIAGMNAPKLNPALGKWSACDSYDNRVDL